MQEFGKDYGTYWEKGNQNEIDIIAINEIDKKALLCEVKMDKQKMELTKNFFEFRSVIYEKQK
ncbi:MAG: hypothetical protein PF693_18950 [Spirochaetia bacterium]|nr:hypothetical protein [Spirochaetia bacterium]